MSIWHYTAVPLTAGASVERRTGEIAGESAAAVRQALRRIGLQVIELRPAGVRRGFGSFAGLEVLRDHLRTRRRAARAEIYDGLATMLDSGLPLVEAIDTSVRSFPRRLGSPRSMLIQLREDVRSGSSLDEAMREHAAWFDPAEIAMVASGQHGGNLSNVLHRLSERHERSGELSHRLLAALTYPAIVAALGIGVVVFLSTKTLPQLVSVLNDAHVEIPALTLKVMGLGEFLARSWPVLFIALVLSAAGLLVLRRMIAGVEREIPSWLRSLSPRVVRRLAIARFAGHLAELVGSGVPLVEAMRVLAPTAGNVALSRRIQEAAEHLEQGRELASALRDEHWFDPEFRRLLDVGQASGELDQVLARLARRYERQANRLIDRLAGLLEPAVILVLAFGVGTVVIAAVLPMVKLQEVIR